MATGYKIRGGRRVRRTAKEQATLDHLKLERARIEVEAGETKGNFVMIPNAQLLKLLQIKDSKTVGLIYLILKGQQFRHRGHPFLMPTQSLIKEGFSRTTQWRALVRLEQVGLISVRRRPPRPAAVTVL